MIHIGDMNSVSCIKDPFNMKYIEQISIFAAKKVFTDAMYYKANVMFKRGNTTATQEIYGTSLVDVFVKVHDFCEQLK